MREVLLPLVLCLVAFVAFDILQGQRDTARLERDNALFEAAGLREAARISGEMLADRDAIDLKRTVELKDELDSNLEQRRAVGDGRQRLRINATCSPAAPPSTGTGGVAYAATAELAADARPDYFTLKDQLALSKQMILGLQDHVQICQRRSQ